MTRKDYVMIAQVIRKHGEDRREKGDKLSHYAIDRLTKALAEEFKDDNIRFDKEKFLEACGIETV